MLIRSTVLLGALASAAAAQSFNVDLGNLGTPPATSYGAAAGQPGLWNDVPTLGVQQLNNLAGTLTPATITVASAANFTFDNLGTFGDDEALMDDILDLPTNITITGLAPGAYTVFTYAWAPDDPIHLTNVAVTGSPDPLQICGGTWGGSHQLGVSYTRHTVVISAASPNLEVLFTLGGGQYVSCNGMQIVQGPLSPGTTYCTAVNNSTGVPAAISASGSSTASQNNLTLRCASMPNNSFGFFLTSTTQGNTPNPGGSQGTLCLAGAIGRYVGPGQIKNSGTLGEFSLQLDLTQTPQPTGFVAVTAGQVWNFTCWYRDVAGGVATSNFSNGLRVSFN